MSVPNQHDGEPSGAPDHRSTTAANLTAVVVFVPVALPLDEAQALFAAARSVFQSLTLAGHAAEHGGELARGMYRLAEAIDARTDSPSAAETPVPDAREAEAA